MATRKTHPRRTRRALSLERPAAPVRTVHARRTGHAPLEELITRLTKRFPVQQHVFGRGWTWIRSKFPAQNPVTPL